MQSNALFIAMLFITLPLYSKKCFTFVLLSVRKRKDGCMLICYVFVSSENMKEFNP